MAPPRPPEPAEELETRTYGDEELTAGGGDGDPQGSDAPASKAGPAADASERGPSEPSLDEVIRSSIDEALARWDAAIGIEPGDEAEVDDLDAKGLLTSASRRAISRYLADRGLGPESANPLKVDPAFLAEHGVPLAAAVIAALEEVIGSTLRATHEGRPTPRPEPAPDIALDFSDLFQSDDEGGS